MERRAWKTWPIRFLSILLPVFILSCANMQKTLKPESSDKFETVRTYVQKWLSATSEDQLLISPSTLKETIVDDWNRQKDKYQLVSVRKPEDYNDAGHIPHSINIVWVQIVNEENLARLESSKSLVLDCYYGHSSMLCSTILNLLGYKCQSLRFGMMGWNVDALVKKPWDQEADFEVEKTVNESKDSYPLPVIASSETDTKSIIHEMAGKYFAGEGSPVIESSAVKAIVDDWDKKKTEYQIVDVRSKSDYEKGHIPHSMHILWQKIAETENLRKMDPGKTIIVYSDDGQIGQLATTLLSLLGYHAVDIKLGMMDWNKAYVDSSKLWEGAAGYPVELTPKSTEQR